MAGTDPVAVYLGSPVEMVRQMAEERGETARRGAVETLLTALCRHRRIAIALPEDVPDDMLATIFVYAQLKTGVSKPVPQG